MHSRIAFSTLAFPGATLAAAVSAGRRWGYSGFAGLMSLEPHLARAGRYGGFSGPAGFTLTARSLKFRLNELGIPWR